MHEPLGFKRLARVAFAFCIGGAVWLTPSAPVFAQGFCDVGQGQCSCTPDICGWKDPNIGPETFAPAAKVSFGTLRPKSAFPPATCSNGMACSPGTKIGQDLGRTMNPAPNPAKLNNPDPQATQNAAAQGQTFGDAHPRLTTTGPGSCVDQGVQQASADGNNAGQQCSPVIPKPGARPLQQGGTGGPAQPPVLRGSAPQANGSDPVSGDGEMVYEWTDLSFPGPGLTYSFTRSYRSRVSYSSALGYGWDHNFNQFLEAGDGCSSDLLFHTGTGGIILFKVGNQSNGDIYYLPPLDVHLSLRKTNQHWEMVDGATTYVFDSNGLLQAIHDLYGNQISVVWARPSNVMPYQVKQVTDTAGRLIQYSYNNLGKLYQVAYETAVVTFNVDPQTDDLVSVTDAKGIPLIYHYTSGVAPVVGFLPDTQLETFCNQACVKQPGCDNAPGVCNTAAQDAADTCTAACNNETDCAAYCAGNCSQACADNTLAQNATCQQCAVTDNLKFACPQSSIDDYCEGRSGDLMDQCGTHCDEAAAGACHGFCSDFWNAFPNGCMAAINVDTGGNVTSIDGQWCPGSHDFSWWAQLFISAGWVGFIAGNLPTFLLVEGIKCVFSLFGVGDCNWDLYREAILSACADDCAICFRYGSGCGMFLNPQTQKFVMSSTADVDCRRDTCFPAAMAACKARAANNCTNGTTVANCTQGVGCPDTGSPQGCGPCPNNCDPVCLANCSRTCTDRSQCHAFCAANLQQSVEACQSGCVDSCITNHHYSDGNIPRYTFGLPQDLNHNLVEIVDGSGRTQLKNVYGGDPRLVSFDRVIDQQLGEDTPDHHLTFQYHDLVIESYAANGTPHNGVDFVNNGIQPSPIDATHVQSLAQFSAVDICPLECDLMVPRFNAPLPQFNP